MSDGCVVRGGGCVEERVAAVVRETKKSVTIPCQNRVSIPYCMRTGWLGNEMMSCENEREMIVEGFAAGLEQFAAAVSSSLRVGGASREVGVAWDAYSCKISSWRTAVQLVRTLWTAKF